MKKYREVHAGEFEDAIVKVLGEKTCSTSYIGMLLKIEHQIEATTAQVREHCNRLSGSAGPIKRFLKYSRSNQIFWKLKKIEE